jgi:hypothetical protein
MPYNTDLADRLRQVLQSLNLNEGEQLGETKMFGGLCFTLNGKMLMGIDNVRIMVRLSDVDFARENEAGRAVPMDFTGRALRNFAFLRPGSYESDDEVLVWAKMSLEFVREHMLNKPTKKRRKP